MNEEIIIDGVNISECCFYNNGKCDNPNGMACNCVNNAVCYFKELIRLEQENKELNFKINQLKANGLYNDLTGIELSAKVVELEQENRALKDNNNHLQVIIDDGRAENKRFREENKELESQRDEARIAYNNLILDIVSDIPFEGEIGGERFISIKDRLHQMQKALASLEEIREIAEKYKDMEGCRIPLGAIKMTVDKVLNLS